MPADLGDLVYYSGSGSVQKRWVLQYPCTTASGLGDASWLILCMKELIAEPFSAWLKAPADEPRADGDVSRDSQGSAEPAWVAPVDECAVGCRSVGCVS